MVKSVETQAVFSHGAEVCAILRLVVDHKVQQFQIVEWYRFEGEKIASIQAFFDTGPFVRQPAEGAHTTVDPVCRMSVDKNAPAAVRIWTDTTYHFCSEGCAIAFDEDPQKYLS